MAIPDSLRDREVDKFGESSVTPDQTIVHTEDGAALASLAAILLQLGAPNPPSGLKIAGLHTAVTVTDASWVKLPATPLSDRNQLNIQNNTDFEMRVRFDAVGGYTDNGIVIPAGGERQYQIQGTIEIYGRLEAGAGSLVIDVEELS